MITLSFLFFFPSCKKITYSEAVVPLTHVCMFSLLKKLSHTAMITCGIICLWGRHTNFQPSSRGRRPYSISWVKNKILSYFLRSGAYHASLFSYLVYSTAHGHTSKPLQGLNLDHRCSSGGATLQKPGGQGLLLMSPLPLNMGCQK